MSDKTSCPFCAEEIMAAAVKCKHCQSDLTPSVVTSSERILEDVRTPLAISTPVAPPTVDYGAFLLGLPLISTMLIIFWVGNMALIQSPGDKLSLIMVLTVAGTAILATIEASKLRMVSDRAQGSYSPTAWFFLIVFLWIVGYPAYLFKRRHYGLSNRLVSGLMVALLFTAAFFYVSDAIDGQRAELKNNLDELQKSFQDLGK